MITAEQLNILITATNTASREFAVVRRDFNRMSRDLTRAGRRLTRTLTLPLLAIGAAATKVAVTFDEEMTKIITLVGIADAQVNQWRESILALGPAVGIGPTELARAMFVVTSAGSRGAEALEVVRFAAMAAAIGLGDTATTARAVTAAMQAYAEQGLTAARATDILVGTVRAGNLEAATLAGSLGRVLATASILGVTFEEVGGFIATFSRLGVSAEESATALRAIFTSMLNPMKETADALATINTTSAELRDQLGREGLLSVLELLVEKFGGNVEVLAKVIPNVRAFTGVMGTAGVQGKAYAQIVDDLNTGLNTTIEAFNRAKKTPAQEWKVFMAEAQRMGIELGTKLIPTFLTLIDTISNVITGWSELSEKSQDIILKIGGIALLIGPLIWSIGLLGKAYLVLTGAIVKATVALHVFHGLQIAVQLIFAATIAGFVAIAVGLIAIGKAALDAEKAQLKLLEVQQRTMETGATLADIWNAKIQTLRNTNAELFESFVALRRDLISRGVGAIQATAKAWFELEIQTTLAAEAARRAAEAARRAGEEIVPPLTDAEKAAKALSESIQETGKEMVESFIIARRMKAAYGDAFDLTAERVEVARSAIATFIAAGVELDAVVTQNGITLQELINFVIGYDQSLIDATASEGALARALDGMKAAAQGALNELRSLDEEQNRIADSIRSIIEIPAEEFARKLQEATISLDLGKIDEAQFDRYFVILQQQLADANERLSGAAAISGKDIGEALVGGMISGLRSGDLGRSMEDAAWAIVRKLINVFVFGFEIASPSKLAIGWGRSVVEGFAIGLSGADRIGFSPVFGGVSAGVGGVGGGSPAPASAGPSAPAALPAGGVVQYITIRSGFDTEGERLSGGRAARRAGEDALTGVI